MEVGKLGQGQFTAELKLGTSWKTGRRLRFFTNVLLGTRPSCCHPLKAKGP